MVLLSLLLFFISFVFGYVSSKKAAWLMLILYPLFSPMSLSIVPSSVLFLNIDRVAFAISVGIHLRNWKNISLSSLFKERFIKLFLIFSGFIIVISLGDRLKNIVFTYIPHIYVALVLGFFVIKEENDFNRALKIFAWQGALFGLIIIMQFFKIFDLPKFLRAFLPVSNALVNYQEGALRYGMLRVSGSDGNSVSSGYRLAFYVFIGVAHLYINKGFVNKIPFVLSLLGIIFLITRAAYVGIFVAFIYLFMVLSLVFALDLSKYIKNIFKVIFYLVIFVVILYQVPVVNRLFTGFVEYSTSKESGRSIQMKTTRFDDAYRLIGEKPILGHGSPQKAYFVMMNTDDLPAPFIFAIAGGIPLLIIYLLMVFYMPYNFFKYAKLPCLYIEERVFLIIVSSAFVAGLVPTFSNWVVGHLSIMVLLYVLTYRYILLIFNRRKMKPNEHK